MLKRQNIKYLDKNITNVFHFLELKGSHNFLIGSNNIRNLLYANDYDLNSNVKTNDSITILKKIYEEFLHIFDTAFKNPDYYIFDFKCGVYNDESIRWSYNDLTKGYVKFGKEIITFEECLIDDNPENKIKLDICYLYNGIFTDINCLYNIHIIDNKHNYKNVRDIKTKSSSNQLKDDIKDLENDGEYYKATKRYFSLSIIEGAMNKKILKIMNSDYGMFYKFISFLNLVVEMIDQNFKPIKISIIKSNLEYIKQFGSHITEINIDIYLNRLIKIIDLVNISIIKTGLEKLITDCSSKLDLLIHKLQLI